MRASVKRFFSLSVLCVIFSLLFCHCNAFLLILICTFFLFLLSACLSRSHVTEYVHRVGFCQFSSLSLSGLVAWSLFFSGTLHLFAKSHFGTLYSTLIHTILFMYTVRFVCLCVKLSRNAALTPRSFLTLFTRPPCVLSLRLSLSHFLPFILYLFDTILS